MKLSIQIISWVMLAFGVIAVIGLLVQANNGQTGDGAGIFIGFLWIVQSVLVLVYVHGGFKELG